MQLKSLVSGRASAQQVISSDPDLRLNGIPMSVPSKNLHSHMHFFHYFWIYCSSGQVPSLISMHTKPMDFHALRDAQTIAHWRRHRFLGRRRRQRRRSVSGGEESSEPLTVSDGAATGSLQFRWWRRRRHWAIDRQWRRGGGGCVVGGKSECGWGRKRNRFRNVVYECCLLCSPVLCSLSEVRGVTLRVWERRTMFTKHIRHQVCTYIQGLQL